jgi:hypothetical protein
MGCAQDCASHRGDVCDCGFLLMAERCARGEPVTRCECCGAALDNLVKLVTMYRDYWTEAMGEADRLGAWKRDAMKSLLQWHALGEELQKRYPLTVGDVIPVELLKRVKAEQAKCVQCGGGRGRHCDFDEPGVDHDGACELYHHAFKEPR